MKRDDRVSRLRLAREAKGLTQWALAAEVEVHVTYLSMVELGRRLPSPRIAARIAALLGLPVTELFTTLEPEKDTKKEDHHAPSTDAARSV